MTVIAHVSQPYVTAGRIIDLYICSLLAALSALFFSNLTTLEQNILWSSLLKIHVYIKLLFYFKKVIGPTLRFCLKNFLTLLVVDNIKNKVL
jgi:hypothetical protein